MTETGLMTKTIAQLAMVRSGLTAITAAWVCWRDGVTTFTVIGTMAGTGKRTAIMFYSCLKACEADVKLTAESYNSLMSTNDHLDDRGFTSLSNTYHDGMVKTWKTGGKFVMIDRTRRPSTKTSIPDTIELLAALGAWKDGE